MHTILVYLIQIVVIGQNYFKKDYEPVIMKFLWVLAAISFVSAYGFVTNSKTYDVHDYLQLYKQLGGNKKSLKEIKRFFECKFKETQISF